MTKLSLYSLLLSISICTGFSALGQDITPNESKFSVEILGGFENHTMTTTINAGNVAGLPDINTNGLALDEIIPKSENGMSIGLRGSYHLIHGISAYGQLGYSKMGKGDLIDVQELIDPILQSGLLPEIDFVDWSLLKIDARSVGDYSLFNSNIGLSFSYNYKDFTVTPYAGLGYYQLNTPGTELNASMSVLILQLDAKGLFSFDEQSKSDLGYQAGLNIVYNIQEKFFIGINTEYNVVNFDFGESNLEFNESAIPSTLTSFLNGVDLSIIPNIPLQTKIDFSSIKYGMTFGMKF